MSNVMLHVAAKAQAIKSGSTTSALPSPDNATLTLLSSWMDSHLQVDSKLFQMLYGRVKAAVDLCIVEESSAQFSSQFRHPIIRPSPDLPALPMATTGPLARKSKRSRESDEETELEQSSNKRVKSSRIETESGSKIDTLLARGGLAPLQREVRLLANRLGTIYRFNFEVHERRCVFFP